MSLSQNFLKTSESQSKSLPLVFALDEGYEQAKIWIDRLQSKIWGFKVGSILFAERGPDIIREIKDQGAKVFLDLKYHDIGRT
ncbi:MAG: orotidine 5'-phosphate decarboxylase / HUMPS family protein, partial [Bdellovibrionota bacterium]